MHEDAFLSSKIRRVYPGLSILPNTNLVSNIGFRDDAMRTKDKNSIFSNLPTKDIWDISHPSFIIQHPKAEAHTFNYNFGGIDIKNTSFIRRKINALKQIIKNN
jgi:hypothetical protein